MKYVKYVATSFAAVLACCTPKLVVQQTLAQRVHRATVACVALPVGPQKAKRCADALLCQASAQSAAEAVQKAQAAVASGSTDVAAEAQAAGLSVLADVACRRGGW